MGSRYWGSLTLGRLLGVVLTAKLSVHQLITLDFLLACIGAVMLLAVSDSSLSGVYVAAAVMGVGFSTLYPMGILLAESKLKADSAWISRLIAGGTIGSVVLPLLVGLLLADAPLAFAWCEAGFILVQIGSYLVVRALPAPDPAAAEPGSADLGTDADNGATTDDDDSSL